MGVFACVDSRACQMQQDEARCLENGQKVPIGFLCTPVPNPAVKGCHEGVHFGFRASPPNPSPTHFHPTSSAHTGRTTQPLFSLTQHTHICLPQLVLSAKAQHALPYSGPCVLLTCMPRAPQSSPAAALKCHTHSYVLNAPHDTDFACWRAPVGSACGWCAQLSHASPSPSACATPACK